MDAAPGREFPVEAEMPLQVLDPIVNGEDNDKQNCVCPKYYLLSL